MSSHIGVRFEFYLANNNEQIIFTQKTLYLKQ